MLKRYLSRLKQILIPCFILSALTGMITGAVIFLFRVCAHKVIGISDGIFGFVRENPAFLPLLLLGAAALGGAVWLILRLFPQVNGGDAQTTITFLRGFVPMKWIPNTVVLFVTSLISYFGGMPLGEEGTSVQLGAAIGKGTVNMFSRKSNSAWDRYIMTGGACGGFAAATSSPITAILFAFDEAHRRFSPIIFMATATATISSWTVMHILCRFFKVEARLFVFDGLEILQLKYLWAPVLVGIICGVLAIVFAKGYSLSDKLIGVKLKKIPSAVKIIFAFVIIAAFGFISADLVGSGHNIIHALLEGHAPVWYLLLLYLVVRSLTFLMTGALDIVGGLSVPVMAIGAIVGSLIAKLLVSFGVYPEECSPVLVVVGVASFLAATNRAPLNAMTFACEALLGFTNFIPIAVGVAFAYIVIEPLGVTAFSDVVIEKKIHKELHGKEMHTVDTHLTAQGTAFITGKEVRDILWPANCVVLSIDKKHSENPVIEEGDVLHLRYKTASPTDTYEILEAIIGSQQGVSDAHDVHKGDDNYTLPEQ